MDQVIQIHETLVCAGPLRDRGVLEGAVAAPFQVVFGVEVHPTLVAKAVKLAEGISRAQAFLDGNKRLAWLSLTTFLHLNGLRVCASQADGAEWVLSLHEAEDALVIPTAWLNDQLDSLL